MMYCILLITVLFVFCPGMTTKDFTGCAFERGAFALYSSLLVIRTVTHYKSFIDIINPSNMGKVCLLRYSKMSEKVRTPKSKSIYLT